MAGEKQLDKQIRVAIHQVRDALHMMARIPADAPCRQRRGELKDDLARLLQACGQKPDATTSIDPVYGLAEQKRALEDAKARLESAERAAKGAESSAEYRGLLLKGLRSIIQEGGYDSLHDLIQSWPDASAKPRQ